MEGVLEAAPGFRPEWEAFLDRWSEEEYLPFYLGMAELAHYLVARYASGQTREFPALFHLVEEQFAENDAELENLIVVGLFEDVQNVASHREFGYQVFRKWLGPKSLAAWDEIDAGTKMVAKWASAQSRPRWWQFWRRWTDFNPDKALAMVENAELKKILEAEFRGPKER